MLLSIGITQPTTIKKSLKSTKRKIRKGITVIKFTKAAMLIKLFSNIFFIL